MKPDLVNKGGVQVIRTSKLRIICKLAQPEIAISLKMELLDFFLYLIENFQKFLKHFSSVTYYRLTKLTFATNITQGPL